MTPYFQESGITLYHGDCRELLPSLGKVDLVLTDPPYGIDYKPSRKLSGCKKWQTQQAFDSVAGDNEPFDPSPFLNGGKCILWGGNHYASRLTDSGGWLVWDKRRGATVSQGFIASDAELAWTNLFGTVRMFSHLWAGLCRDSEVGQHYHPTQKPVALMEWCIELAGDVQSIFDPYSGSGTTGVACAKLGRNFIGCEIEEKYCEIAAKRISRVLAQGDLFAPSFQAEPPKQLEMVA